MLYWVRRWRFSDLKRLPSSRQIRYSGVIDFFTDTAGFASQTVNLLAAGYTAAQLDSQDFVAVMGARVRSADGDQGLMSLVDFMRATTAARHDIHDFAAEHPDTLLPGTPVAPDCTK